MSVPTVSVVMSVYNGLPWLAQAIESILQQDYPDFELIIINDGSTDGSSPVLHTYAARDPRIRLIEQANQGLTMALIQGCAAARGRYIARQDADDLSAPNRLSLQAAVLDQNPRVVMVSCWAEALGPQGERLEQMRCPVDAEAATAELMHQRVGPPAHGTLMFRTSTYRKVGGYRPELYYAQDSDLWRRLGLEGLLHYAPQVLYRYRRNPRSISALQSDRQRQFGDLAHAAHLARLAGEDEKPFLDAAAGLRQQCLRAPNRKTDRRREAAANYLIGASLSRQNATQARSYLWKALQQNPLSYRTLAQLALHQFRSVRRLVSSPAPGKDH